LSAPSPRRAARWLLPEWPVPDRVHGLVTTRSAAGLALPFDAGPARLDALDEQRRAHVQASRQLLDAALPAAPVWLEQVHGIDVIDIDATNLERAREVPPRADAAVTRLAGVPLAIRTADCLPVLFADRDATLIAVAHAGWRGLAAGVIEATLRAMALAPERVVAWIGPGIGPRAFEVGRDVVEAFVGADAGAAAHFSVHRPQKWLADLPGLARRRLSAAGVSSVHGGNWCTFSDGERFPSWRRDRSEERLAAVAWRDAATPPPPAQTPR